MNDQQAEVTSDPDLYELPMFPLGSVLFPFGVMPLRVFEDRYKALTEDVLAGNREFGVVLIERGSEVGGGDVRFPVATVATVLEAEPTDDGGWYLVTFGTRRIEVLVWTGDDPYPVALVRNLDPAPNDRDEESEDEPDHPDSDDDPSGAHMITVIATDEIIDQSAVESMISGLRKVLALRSELNEPAAPATIEFDSYLPAAIWQACAVLPVGPLDDMNLLRCATMAERISLLQQLIDDERLVLGNRLAGG
jgi:uncharacterized protein